MVAQKDQTQNQFHVPKHKEVFPRHKWIYQLKTQINYFLNIKDKPIS